MSRIFTKLTQIIIYYGTNDCLKFWGHSGIAYAGIVSAQAEAYSTQRLVLS